MFAKKIIGSLAYTLEFGKYKGQRLDNVLYLDPSYILWLKKSGALNLADRIIKEAEEVLYAREEQDLTECFADYNECFY